MFSKILIANRGEIAIRIIRACKEMGIETVAVFSEADKSAMHVALADESICIGSAEASKSYLDAERIVSAALATKVQAIHPGYGFLSESSRLAALCEKNQIAFIGPKSQVLSKVGDKDKARQVMSAAGIKVIPGTGILADEKEALDAAEKIGYPVMLKARAGREGKGLRVVNEPADIEISFQMASREAQDAFGDGAMYMEKCIVPARHIEVQLIIDELGHTVCLGERDSSVQRNYQKLLDEAPSPGCSEAVRLELYELAQKAAKAADYIGVGSVEFLVDTDENIFFMEINLGLQAEHGVSEQVTSIDIVKWQIRIAAGVALDFTQDDIVLRGCSIQCRINATATGKVAFLHLPGGPEVRFDSALWNGYEMPSYYDMLLGKLMVHAATREEAIRKMHAALCELVIDGVKKNIDEHIGLVSDSKFQSGAYHVDFIARKVSSINAHETKSVKRLEG
ncbi:MAG: ATP-grasp domain-containing protein [Oscillospiraceae bacterium]|nr:ATP-grasp domain-containing protein [Oscillospiraceae bacterium]